MLPVWQLTPLETDSAKEAWRSIKPFDELPENCEAFSDDIIPYASFVKVEDEFMGLKPFPTEKDIRNNEEVIFNRKNLNIKVDVNFPLDQDLTWEVDNDKEDDISTRSSQSTSVTSEQLQYMQSYLKCIYAVLYVSALTILLLF